MHGDQSFEMDCIEEPQKKIFKARKTMRVSDRHQLEAVYRVRDELLKTDAKLVNGNHENGDLDPSSPLEGADYMKDDEDMNGIDGVCFDPEDSKTEWEEAPGSLTVKVKTKQGDTANGEPLPSGCATSEAAPELNPGPASGEPASSEPASSDQASGDQASGDQASGEPASSELTSSELTSSELTSSEPASSEPASSEPTSSEPASSEPASSEPASSEPASSEPASSELASSELASSDQASSEPASNELASNEPASSEPATGEAASGVVAPGHSEGVDSSPGDVPCAGAPPHSPASVDHTTPRDPTCEEAATGDLAAGDSTAGERFSDKPVSAEEGSAEAAPGATRAAAPGGLPAAGLSAGDDLPAGDPGCSARDSDDPASSKLAPAQPASGEPAAGALTRESTPEPTLKPTSGSGGEPVPETDHPEQSSSRDGASLASSEDGGSADRSPRGDALETSAANPKEGRETDGATACSDLPPENEQKASEDPAAAAAAATGAVGDEAISSSVQMDGADKDEDEEESAARLLQAARDETAARDSGEESLEHADSMETDEIIPILEKLAPSEDELTCFSKSSLLPMEEASLDLEEKMEGSFGSPSKQESNESLPKEAFLVLSDEEDMSCEKDESEAMPQLPACSPAEVETNEKDNKPEEEEPVIEEEEERPSEKSECSRRKRSKSEDIDNAQSKRRRYLEDEYEAELQVKITAKGDIHQKLQKVVQWLLEEKLCALQCAVFDKTLAELKTRVEKIECNKRHKTVLTELQAKVARLTKRFGAAKEDLKKRQESPPNPPVSPGKPVNDINSNNNMVYRTAGTVRQMLESKRNVSENAPPSFQTPVNTVSSSSLVAPAVVSSQPKLPTPATSGSLTAAPLVPAPSTATVVATSQVPSGNPQPTISLQSLPVILHVPVAVPSQPQLLQSHPGTIVTNQPSGSVEFISVQSPPAVSGLTKNPVSLPPLPNPAKPGGAPPVPSPGMQRSATLAVQAVPTAHSIVQATRTSLPPVGPSGLYSSSSPRGPIQMKIPISAFSTSSPAEHSSPAAPRPENQANKTVDAAINKKAADSTSQSGKAPGSDSGGVIDLTMDEEEGAGAASQDHKKPHHTPVPAMTSPQPLPRPLQPIQPAPPPPPPPSGVPTSGPSQTTIHLLPPAPTTVNVTHRPVTQVTTRLPVPRAPANHQVVYTALPAPPAQAPLRGAAVPAPAVRQLNPPNSVTVRVPQATTYVVNNGLTLGSAGPQLTVHHRPPQVHTEAPRPVHPAPLPEAPQPQRLPPEAAGTSLPQKPHLKLARVQSQNGIVLSWSVLEVDRACAAVDSYHLYAYHEEPSATAPSQWKKIGEVKALPLPMACTLTQFVSGSKYYFAVRAKDVFGRFGPFCDPQSTDVIASTQNS
ncbi:activating transcription factor 7-interacting protein 1-like isoform X1 [Dipodomys merriami]|uniref:activating transcription factor 7-interacting protein 1-like isoform X1 n=2 Tax=Dipodomys merriami TaxID=94247 RepID=UPI0038558A2B